MGSPTDRLHLYASMVRYGRAHNRDFAHQHYAFFSCMQERLLDYIGELSGKRVLDAGCGKAFWLTLLLHSAGALTTGIDTEAVTPGAGLSKYLNILRRNRPERALRTLVWEAVYAGPYYRELAKVSPFPLQFEGVDLRGMSVTELDFAAETFDLVVSHEMFEHLPDVRAALHALQRVMKPDGITYIYIHNYASVSGGHHIGWKYPDTEPSETVPAWDHLRQNLFSEIPSWINRLRMADYRQAFEEQFAILDWFPAATEGEALLTSEIEAELSDYDRDELLTKGYIIIASPKTTKHRFNSGSGLSKWDRRRLVGDAR